MAVITYKEAVRLEVENALGSTVATGDFNKFYGSGSRKLDFIIEREGDLGGLRREPWYLGNIIAVNMAVHSTDKDVGA